MGTFGVKMALAEFFFLVLYVKLDKMTGHFFSDCGD